MRFSTAQWIAWLGATVVAAVTLIVGAYGQFETKEHSQEGREQIEHRLDRMENKIDILVERKTR